MSDVKSKIKSIIAEQLGTELDKVTDQADFIADLGADSLDTVELLMALEEHFGVEIPDDVAENIKTVEDVYQLINTETA